MVEQQQIETIKDTLSNVDNLKSIFGEGVVEWSSGAESAQVAFMSLGDEIFWATTSILLTLLYFWILAYYKSALSTFFSIQRRGVNILRSENEGDVVMTGLLNFCYYWMQPLMWGYLCAVMVKSFGSYQVSPLVSFGLGLLVTYLLLFFKRTFDFLISYLTDNKSLHQFLYVYSKIESVSFVLLFLPLIILLSFSKFDHFYTLILLIIPFLYSFVSYILSIYHFFKGLAISFLQYILYLCTVEMVPLSFVVIAFWRNFTE